MKVVALYLVLSAAQVYAQANLSGRGSGAQGPAEKSMSQDHISGRLATSKNYPILVDGVNVITGTTILSGAHIETFDDVGATIQLKPLGRLDIAPNTRLTLTFDKGNVSVDLVTGCMILTVNKGINGSVKTPEGTTKKADPAKGSSIDACADPDAMAPVVNQTIAAARR